MMKSIYELAISLVQHHQGITGTSRQHVANDYATKLYKGRENCYESSKEEIKELFDISKDFETCDFLNVTICNLSEPGFLFGVINLSVFYWLIYHNQSKPKKEFRCVHRRHLFSSILSYSSKLENSCQWYRMASFRFR